MMNEEPPHVLVGCPTHEVKWDALDRYVEGLRQLTYPHFDILLEDNSPTPTYSERLHAIANEWNAAHPYRHFNVIYSGSVSQKARERLVNGRNKLREIALRENYDYFLSLEQDVIPPKDVIEQLLARKKDVVSGAYLNADRINFSTPNLVLMAGYIANEAEKKKGIFRIMGVLDLFPSRLIECGYAGLGCMLISRKVLNSIPFRYDEKMRAFDDMHFCMDAHAAGYATYVDSAVLCAHYFNDAFMKEK